MAKITREQLNKINSKLQNGFTLDLTYFLTWGEKRVHKYLELEDGKKLEAVIEYRDYSNLKNPEKDLRIEVITSVWKPTISGCWSCDSGYRHSLLSKNHDKRLFKAIETATASITDSMIFDIDACGRRELENGMLF